MNILIIAGGTGGHVYPALSIANEFQEDGNTIYWIGKKNSLEENLALSEDFSFYSINARGFLGKNFFAKIGSIFFVFAALIRSFFLIITIKPDIIVTTGGYLTLAPGLIGSLFCPLFIHEQNSVPGLTNRILHKRSKITFEAFPDTFNNLTNKVKCVGNPIREDIVNISPINKSNETKFNILILGGSQGSKQINDILINILLTKKVPSHWSFIHQVGKLTSKELKDAYTESGNEFVIKEFLENIAEAYQFCDIVISRSGAMTVSEICSVQKPSILLPLPWSSENHQYINAQYLKNRGAAEIIDSDVSNSIRLLELLINLESDHNRLHSMAYSASKVFPKFASKNIYKSINESLTI